MDTSNDPNQRQNTEIAYLNQSAVDNEYLYRDIFLNAPVGVVLLEPGGHVQAVNRAAERLLGYATGELTGKCFTELIHSDDVALGKELFGSLVKGTNHYQVAKRFLRKHGDILWIRLRISSLQDSSGAVGQIVAVCEDIHEWKPIQNALQESQAYLRRILSVMTDDVAIAHRSGQFRWVPTQSSHYRAFCDRTSNPQTASLSIWQVFPQWLAQRFYATILEVLAKGHPQNLEYSLEVNGYPVCFHARFSQFNDNQVVWVARDISDRKQIESQLIRSTLHDQLTQLPNRNLLERRLQALINRGQQCRQPGYAVLFLDVDRFQQMNEHWGHLIGDQVLIQVARKLRSLARETDVVARWGGDEFVILLEDADPLKGAVRLGERLGKEFQRPLLLGEREMLISLSIGIVIGNSTYHQALDLIKDADLAMYQAKGQGRNQYEIFDVAIHNSALQRLQVESELHQAIQRQELVVHYQPIMSLSDSTPVGLEALVRWQHPQHGLIGPDSFITLAEEVGLIAAIDRWVLGQVGRQLKQWQRILGLHHHLRVAINLSVQDLWNLQLIDEIEQVLQENHLEGRQLTLEITESMLVNDSNTTAQLLTQLKQRGIAVSIDDFGTGYSSLSYLHRLPADALKIDRSFVGQMQFNHRNQKIVETIIALSKQLQLQVIAEGIETLQQWQTLKQLGCDRGQGFLFSPPLEATAATRFLQKHLGRHRG